MRFLIRKLEPNRGAITSPEGATRPLPDLVAGIDGMTQLAESEEDIPKQIDEAHG